jgi:hypothetical protein
VEAFYRQDVVQALCQPWGLRLRLLALLQKSLQARGAVPLLDNIIPNEEQRDIESFLTEKTISARDNFFSYTDGFIRIDSFVPTQTDYFGNCMITIKQPDCGGCGFLDSGIS